jgi:tetratricopeptide (TPR) repeat protein/tRNA A-37 threonylcarbamoyl transferase component Bud32
MPAHTLRIYNLPRAALDRQEQVVARFEEAWQQGTTPVLSDYLQGEPGERLALLNELIHTDLEYRIKAGMAARVETYLAAYPELDAHPLLTVQLIAAEYEFRRRAEPDLAAAEFLARFPQYQPELEPLLAGSPPFIRSEGEATAVATHPFVSVGKSTSEGLRFRIVRFYAEGALGKVSVAHDAELHREVALKEIQDRFADNADSRNRFLLEAEITGALEHPGIVPVYGLGQHANGRPFYAMRFVRGDSLKDAIERFHRSTLSDKGARRASDRGLEVRQLLGRFIDVCQAIQYAHDRGVLHRDLKPSNIMLGKYGETFVLDWGLAKVFARPGEVAAPREGAEPTLQAASAGSAETVAGTTIGTPQYMSPEQAAGQLAVLGPASDVYSLGATLFTLLTGKTAVVAGDTSAVIERVQKGDFPKPRAVKADVDPALEAICLKAMALQPADRYVSPRALAEDLERWLADEPVGAWPEPWTRRTRRLLGRHRTLVTAAAAALGVAVVGLLTATALLTSANEELDRERQRAENNATDARRQQKNAEKQTELATAEATKARRISEVLVGMFEAPDPLGLAGTPLLTYKAGEALTALQILDQGAARVHKELGTEPEVQARLMDALGGVYIALGHPDKAAPLLEQALTVRDRLKAGNDAELAATLHHLGMLHHIQGDYAKAEGYYSKALDLRRLRQDADPLPAAFTTFMLAWLLTDAEDLERGEALFKEAIRLRRTCLDDDHRDVAIARLGLAAAYIHQGKYWEAVDPSLRGFAALSKAQTKKNIPDAVGLFQRGVFAREFREFAWLTGLGGLDGAERNLRRSLELTEKFLGNSHPFAGYIHLELAKTHEVRGDPSKADESYRDALRIGKPFGLAHPKMQGLIVMYSRHLSLRGKRYEAGKLLEEAIEATRARFGANHILLGRLLIAQGAFAVADADRPRREQLYREARAIYERTPGGTKRLNYPDCLCLLAASLDESRAAEGEKLCATGMEAARKHRLRNDQTIAHLLLLRAQYRMAQKTYQDVESWIYEGQAIFKRSPGSYLSDHCMAWRCLERLYRETDRPGQAVSAALERRKTVKNDAKELFDVARSLAQSAALVKEAGERAKIEDQAIGTLRQVHTRKAVELRGLRTERAFDALRERQDYQELLKAGEADGK